MKPNATGLYLFGFAYAIFRLPKLSAIHQGRREYAR